MFLIIILISLTAGIIISLQQTINGKLGQVVGILESALISFAIGTLFLFIIFIYSNDNPLLLLNMPKLYLSSAFFGIVFLTIMPLVIPKIGVTNALVMVIIGQLLCGLIIDHFGLFGSQIIQLDIKKLIGIIFLCLSLVFMFINKSKPSLQRH